MLHGVLLSILGLMMGVVSSPTSADEPLALSALNQPGRVLILRHASAPGFSDPPQFRIGDCSTQRNLDADGRLQARRLGERLRAAGIVRARVLSSQWCRCLETAKLLDLGPVEALPALNSFFQRPAAREPTLLALGQFLAGLPTSGEPVILVTHQVVVDALISGTTPAGGGSIFQLNGSAAPFWLGRIAAD
jgi:phosphohistidine phosphatase SixA